MYYIFGDIHGCAQRLAKLFARIEGLLREGDTMIFLGDYIDRGSASCEVIEYLMALSRVYRAVFLKGNHESMLLDYLSGKDPDRGYYFYNGGDATMRSYRRQYGEAGIPDRHLSFLENLGLYHEGENFIAVHAGLNPKIYTIEAQSEHDMIWIREAFFLSPRRWEKTVIFGHTPTTIIGERMGHIHADEEKNIIGIDTGAVYGGLLTCMSWPGREIFQE